MRLLIADIVWRVRWKAAAFSVILAVIFGTCAAIGDVARAFGASMGVAFAVGTMAIWPTPKIVWYLPISRRDVWRAQWLVATIGVTLLTTVIKLAALLVPYVRDSLGLASIVLSSLYDFAYVGAGCGLVVLATRPHPARGPWRPVSAFLKGLAEFALAGGCLLAVYWGFPLGRVLPTRWTDLTAVGVAVLVTALGVAVATYFHAPVPPAHANPTPERVRAKGGTPRFQPGGLSGLLRLLVHEAAWTLMVGGALVIASAVVVIVGAQVAQSPEGVAGFLRSLLLRLDGQAPATRGAGLEAFILLIAFAIFAGTLTVRFPLMIRHLRVLPLGATRLNALFLAWPAAIWFLAWTFLLALHDIVLGEHVVSYHADAFLAFTGVSAIVRAMTLRFSGSFSFVVLAALMVIVPALILVGAPPPAALVAIGVGGFAAAAALNRSALARRSTYAPAGPSMAGGFRL